MRYTYDQPEYLDVDGARHLVQELKVYIQEILNGNIDITQYATKEELSNAVSSIDLTGYATKSYVDENIANVATGGEVDLSNYVTKDTVYTKEDVYTKEETDAKVTELEPITEDEIKALFETEGLATEEYVSTAINSIPATDLSNYYTKDETYNKTEVDTLVANSGGSSSGGETTTPTVTLAITGNASLKNGFARTYKAVYTDADGTDVTANYSTTWELTSDTVAVDSYITQEVGSNQNKLLYEDENEDVLEETVTLTAIPSDSNIANASIELTLTSAF